MECRSISDDAPFNSRCPLNSVPLVGQEQEQAPIESVHVCAGFGDCYAERRAPVA